MYERGLDFLQDRESKRQAEEQRLAPSFTPQLAPGSVELAEAAEPRPKGPDAMYKRGQRYQQQVESKLSSAAQQACRNPDARLVPDRHTCEQPRADADRTRCWLQNVPQTPGGYSASKQCS